MPISITLPPAQTVPAAIEQSDDEDYDILEDLGLDAEGDQDMTFHKTSTTRKLVTPGETVTSDPQWMR